MPTPVGHALGGLAAAFFTSSAARRPWLPPTILLAATAVAIAPDLDLLAGSHRTYTHSLGASLIVAAVAAVVLARRAHALSSAIILSIAHASHVLLDWLGKDTARPPGLTALWPFSSTFYISGLDVFGEVSRRYWLPHEFFVNNFVVIVREVAILLPLALVAWVVWSGRTVRAFPATRRR